MESRVRNFIIICSVLITLIVVLVFAIIFTITQPEHSPDFKYREDNIKDTVVYHSYDSVYYPRMKKHFVRLDTPTIDSTEDTTHSEEQNGSN